MRFVFVIAAILIPLIAVADDIDPASMQTQAPTGRIIVKFTEDAELRIGEDGLEGNDAAAMLERLAIVAPGFSLDRRFSRNPEQIVADRLRAEARIKHALPDLNKYAVLNQLIHDRAALIEIIRKLMADPLVDSAFLEPVVVPASLGFDAFTGAVPDLPQPRHGERSDTPDFTANQGYLNAPPEGVNAWAVADSTGGDGSGVKVVDVEGAWLWTHEDLPTPFLELGGQYDNLSWRNHGTAVMGEIRGSDNDFGVRGIAPAAMVGSSSIAEQWTADAIYNAAVSLDPGDIILIELHAPGPNSNGDGQYGYVCMEYWQDNFDAILMATALGVIVCEAAGNGAQDLDDPVYQNLFDRNLRDSGAILCGASVGADLNPASFTNYGSRLDLHGWGYDVTTCGYGSLYGGDTLPEEQWYTSGFNGTSSASPIVVGSVAALQGLAKSRWGFPLDPRLARDLLVATGTPQEEPETQIGPRPDILAAWLLALEGIGEISGIVTDAVSSAPLEGARVRVAETGGFDYTDASGAYRLSLASGDYTLEFDSGIFYQSASEAISITDGASVTLDAALMPTPSLTHSGYVKLNGGAPAEDARVRITNIDLPVQWTDALGFYSFTGVPVDTSVTILIDSVPGFSAMGKIASTHAPEGTEITIFHNIFSAELDFENDDGGFSAESLWTWGTPLGDAGPAAGFSGARCWGVGMEGDYPDDVFAWLTSPSYDYSITDVVAFYFSFHFWSETESGFDGVRVEFWNFHTGEWVSRAPIDGYSDPSLSGIGNMPGWSGSDGGWRGAFFDISDLQSPDVRVRLAFGSDSGVNGPGFWIDDLSFITIGWPTDAEAPVATDSRLAVFPNPFNPQATLFFSLSDPERVEIAVYDLEGRLVRRLADDLFEAGEHRLEWKGRDEHGREVASGVYLAQLLSPTFENRVKMVLVR